MADIKPIFLALDCSSAGSFPEIIEINIILSTPNIISKMVSVNTLVSAAVVNSSCIVVQ
jgi:hypothetical protein